MMTEHEKEAQQLSCAFGQGASAARRAGFMADNPHPYESDRWYAWVAGWDDEKPEAVTYTIADRYAIASMGSSGQ